MVPHTEDGRVLFAVPWLNRVIVGTTDTAVDRPSETPVPLDQEIDFLLRHASRYLQKSPTRKDVLSMFAGLRPLIKSGSAHSTAEISRDHSLLVSNSGLLTITGGKWTTYRRMAQDTIDKALVIGGFGERPCKTETLAIHGAMNVASHNDARQGFGTDLKEIEKTLLHFPERVAPLHPNLPYLEADVYWAIEHEMAQTLEDVLSRRTRCLLLDARATQEIAPRVSQILAQVLGKDENWRRAELEKFLTLTQTYLTE
jgi:glycerol-3-phosphate dehydrogenase